MKYLQSTSIDVPDIELLAGLVLHKRLNDEVCELAFRYSDLQLLVHPVCQPLPRTVQVHVNLDQSQLTTTLDQLVWLHNQMLQLAETDKK